MERQIMELTVQGKQIDVGDSLRTHVTDKLEDINQKYFNHTTFATVTFSKEGHGHSLIRAHINMQLGKDIMVLADGIEGDPYPAFDSAAEKVAKQMRRYKKRLRDHHGRTDQAEMTKAIDYVLAANESEEKETDDVPQGEDPVIIAEMATAIQTMSVGEAVMRMDLSGQSAMLFRNANHQGLNMVYRRPDGNIGWIDPAEADSAKIAS